MRGGLTITAAAPSALASRVYSMHVRTPSAEAPTMTLARPSAALTTASTIWPRSRSVSRETSPVTPSAVMPFTPDFTTRSTTRVMLDRSTSPAPVNGVGNTEYTPSNTGRPPDAASGEAGT